MSSTLRSIPRGMSRPTLREIASSILAPSNTCRARPQRQLLQSPSHSSQTRAIHASRVLAFRASLFASAPSTPGAASPRSRPPVTTDRGPASSESTQTDFSTLDVLGATPIPSTSIDACLWDGFHLNNGVKITEGAGVLLVAGEAFVWKPWTASSEGQETRLLNTKGQWEVNDDAWGLLGVVWPKPDLLILGLGPKMSPLSPATRKAINALGVRVDIQDTRNAAAQFNLLATERGVGSVAAALIPLGWKEGVGVKSSSS